MIIPEVTEKQLAMILKLYELYKADKIPQPSKHVVHPELELGSKENYLYFTVPCSINFQRNSPALWQSALDSYNDTATRFLYDPEAVTNASVDEVQKAMLKHKLALQQNKHPYIWKTISTTLFTKFDGDPRKVIQLGDKSIPKIIQILNDNKVGFPYLSGLKISNYWLFILSRFTDIEYANLQHLSIIPDTHVIQSSIYLGLAPKGATPATIDEIWRPILEKLNIPPGDMHSALWNWSRNQFIPSIEAIT